MGAELTGHIVILQHLVRVVIPKVGPRSKKAWDDYFRDQLSLVVKLLNTSRGIVGFQSPKLIDMRERVRELANSFDNSWSNFNQQIDHILAEPAGRGGGAGPNGERSSHKFSNPGSCSAEAETKRVEKPEQQLRGLMDVLLDDPH